MDGTHPSIDPRAQTIKSNGGDPQTDKQCTVDISFKVHQCEVIPCVGIVTFQVT